MTILPGQYTLRFMKTRYTVVTVNGTSQPMTKGRAERIARWLTTGMRAGRRLPGGPIDAKVVEAK